ncbi:uncharacterized protein VP01_12g5 [Puccinia sorghi]|uniref:Uncharacterized protein n=1 Tax=Puccinia sorghi TaxID=27349 RepID=A0A0L6VND0_9BASI|nr:uncharacterized protein VP01_12g5 [Puccinia sorghi]
MGIQGLLPFLKSIQRDSHIRNWAGKTLAIDGYVWLHRGAYHCAQELCLGKPTIKHVEYFMHKIDLLHKFGVSAYVVFDGDHLPSKKTTENDRENRRKTALTNAHRLLALGDQNKAREEFVKAVDVTPQLAYDVILALRTASVKYVVAPYEADAQLRYLEMKGEVDAIITEDSDLLVYGARNVLFKMDPSGHCIHICRDEFSLVEDKRMGSWTEQEFRQMAIRHKTAQRAIKATRLDGKLSVPLKYELSFREAELTFQHQFVYDPTTRAMVPLTPLPSPPPPPESLTGCGQKWPDEVAVDVAEGRVDPVTKQAFSSQSAGTRHWPPLRSSKTSTPKQSSSKRPALSSGKQSTLNQFAFNKTNSNVTALAPRPTPVQSSSTGLKSDKPPSPQSVDGMPSKFFECRTSKHTDQSCLPTPGAAAESHEFIATQTTIEDLPAEDAVPLTQEGWDAISEMSTGDSDGAKLEDRKQETEFDRLISEDLPSSQMHDPFGVPTTIHSISRAPLQPCISSSSISSNFTASNKENHPPTFNDDPLDTSVCASSSQEIADQPCQDFSDDVDSNSEPDEGNLTITKPRVTIITPTQHQSTSLLLDCRQVSEPIPRQTRRFPISSDPILSSDNEEKVKTRVLGVGGGPTRRKGVQSSISHSHQPPKRVCRGLIETPSSKLSKVVKRSSSTAAPYDEDMSPSLARVASGIRHQFTYQKPSSSTNRQPIGVPKLFDFSKTNHTSSKADENHTGLKKQEGPQQSSSHRRSFQLTPASLNGTLLDDARSHQTDTNADPLQADPPIKRPPTARKSSASKQRSPATPTAASNNLSMFKFRGSLDPPPNPV